ncbi:MAG: hypothetical protein IJ587_05150 [Synergistaceae bacterium]|nr:hypothetical protein [Synergistaceae bacterium]
MNACDRFFHMTEMFNMTEKDWEELLLELESLSPAQRRAAFCRRDEVPYWEE